MDQISWFEGLGRCDGRTRTYVYSRGSSVRVFLPRDVENAYGGEGSLPS